MMMLSGYTLGFFFPKQAKFLAAASAELPADQTSRREAGNLNETRPDADSESREVPASLHFHRYF